MSTTATAARRTPFVSRLWRASLLRAEAYEEVEADPASIVQAAAVVLLACVASATGFWLRLSLGHALPPGALPLPLQLTVIFLEPLVLWGAGSAFAYMVGASFFRGRHTQTDYVEVLRTTGFAFAPALLAVFAFVPPDPVGFAVLGLARLWTLAACVVAIRQALDFDTLRAVGTFGTAALLLWLVLWGLSVAPLPT